MKLVEEFNVGGSNFSIAVDVSIRTLRSSQILEILWGFISDCNGN